MVPSWLITDAVPPGSPLIPCYCQMYSIVWKYHVLFIYQLMDIWCISTFWLWGIMPLWTFMYPFLCEHTFSILLVSYPGMRLLSCVVNLRLTLGRIVGWFSKATASFCVSTSMRIRAPVPLCLSHAWLLSICLMTVTTLWMKWYLTWFQCAEP